MSERVARIIAGLESLPQEAFELSRLLARADSHHVLGQLAVQNKNRSSGKVKELFEQALTRTEFDHRMLVFEMNRIERAIEGTCLSPVLLKGATYVATKSKAAKGRRVSDIDILVSATDLNEIEKSLQAAGWEADEATDNPYDQAYYRDHMHELPPLRHRTRGNIIDVHHQLLPKTARYALNHAQMIEDAVPLPNSKLRVFGRKDVFIHSCAHAFADGALDTPLRTCVELYYLFLDLDQEEVSQLADRAKALGGTWPVAIACWWIAKIFLLDAANHVARQLRHPTRGIALKWAIQSKLKDGYTAPLAKFYMYVRSHYLRMPLYLLIPHLMKKAFKWRPKSDEPVRLTFPKV